MTTKEKLAELVTKLYQESDVTIKPTFPRLLVRLLPREQQTKGGIYLPEGEKQNKPVHEGVVLDTYEPFWQSVSKTAEWEKLKSHHVVMDEHDVVRKVWQECAVKIGDHVTFAHMAFGITPVWPLDGGVGEYRLVPEGEIQATLRYEDVPARTWLERTISDYENHPQPDSVQLSDYLMNRANIIRKDLKAKTVSGK